MWVLFGTNMHEAKSGGDEAETPAEGTDEPNLPTAAVLWAHSDPDWQAEQREHWKESILRLTRLLRDNGIDADLDLFHGHEPTDWARFGPRAIEASDWVLVVVSPEWRRAFQGSNNPTESAGTVGEANTLLGMFKNDQAEFRRRVVLVLLPGREKSDIPPGLVATTPHVRVPSLTSEGLEDLLRILHGRPAYPKPVPGPAPELAPLPVAPYVDPPDDQIDDQIDGDPPVETYIPIDRFDVVEAPIPPIGWAANEAFSVGFPPGWYDTTATEPTIEGKPALVVLRRDDRTGRPSDVASRGVIRCFSHGRGPQSEFFAVAGKFDQVRARATRRRVVEPLRFVRAGGAPCYTFRLDGETQIKTFQNIPSALTEVHLFHDDEWFFMQLESDPSFHAEYQQDLATVLGTLTWKRGDVEPASRPVEQRSAAPPDPADSLGAFELANMWWHRLGFSRDKLPTYGDACRRCGGTNKLLYTGASCPNCNGTGRRLRPE